MESKNSKTIAAIGGIFIYSEKPRELADWYKKHLGIEYEYTQEYNAFYSSFPYKDLDGKKKYYTAWSILSSKLRPKLDFRAFTVNYRVYDIEDTVAYLKLHGVSVRGVDTYPEGKFAWLDDPEGNHIELWEDTTVK
jgi:D-3-phosphoglycerate dehydrogenase